MTLIPAILLNISTNIIVFGFLTLTLCFDGINCTIKSVNFILFILLLFLFSISTRYYIYKDIFNTSKDSFSFEKYVDNKGFIISIIFSSFALHVILNGLILQQYRLMSS